MTRTNRVLEVLTLFSERTPRLRADDISAALGVAPASAYRYIQDLTASGLLEAAGGGVYVLGPAIVELDRRIRLSDPLIDAATPVMERLAESTGALVLLCRLHGRKVLCVQQVAGRHAPARVSYERGRAMPLYRGATSKVILANLPRTTVEKMAHEDAAAIGEADLPTDPQALFASLQALRTARVCTSVAEVDDDTMGWAVAIMHGRRLLGSLSAVLPPDKGSRNAALVADQVLRAGLRIEGRLESETTSSLMGRRSAVKDESRTR